jgi:hypothetical protein
MSDEVDEDELLRQLRESEERFEMGLAPMVISWPYDEDGDEELYMNVALYRNEFYELRAEFGSALDAAFFEAAVERGLGRVYLTDVEFNELGNIE